MPKQFRNIIAATLACVMSAVASAELPADQEADIQYLLEYVAGSGCTFIRNGSENDPEAAADHLRLKYKRGKRYFNTAEQFIDRLASESSWTGKKYKINCDGEVSESGVWLHKALNKRRSQEPELSKQPL